MSIKFTSVRSVVENKILRNSLCKDLCKTQIDISKDEIKRHKRCMESCDVKMQILDNVNIIENMQLTEYAKDREISNRSSYNDISNIDKELYEDTNPITTKIIENKERAGKLVTQIEEIGKKIPKTGVAINYKIDINRVPSLRLS